MAERKRRRRSSRVTDYGAAIDLANMVAAMQAQVDLLESFAEDVLLTAAKPDMERYIIQGKYAENDLADSAMEAVASLVSKYRRMAAYLEERGVDIDDIIGDADRKRHLS